MTASAARRLARFVVGLSLDRVPTTVTTAASLLALDTLGNALAASREGFGVAVLGVAERLGGVPESVLIGGRREWRRPTPCSPTRRWPTCSPHSSPRTDP
jgi:2-methylcitrate dehydratase PrpD